MKFEINGKDFLLDGKKINIYSGAIHYFRVPAEYWEDRLTKLKLAGFNTVETYVCWNLHEPKVGEFDFSGNLDIVRFLRIAEKVGLLAIVRPGPYICAEWDFGGLPAWLLADKNMQLRCNYPPFLAHVKRFYTELLGRVNPLQCTHGGNVIAMQIENEFGSYGNEKAYLLAIKDIMIGAGVEVLMFTSDGNWNNMLSGGTLPDVYKVLNFGSRAKTAFGALRGFQENAPLMCGEFWCGWFDYWGGIHHTRGAEKVASEIADFLGLDASFNIYMFHGGTNFGFTAGANCHVVYSPQTTSYDYSAPLTENGDYTPTYHKIRELLHKKQGLELGELPAGPETQAVGRVELTEVGGLFENIDNLGTKHRCSLPVNMEALGQSFGYILYRTKIEGSYSASKLSIDGVHDRAYVFVDGKEKAIFDRREGTKRWWEFWRKTKKHEVQLPAFNGAVAVDVLVDCMGRINYGKHIYDRKGIDGGIYVGAQTHMGYDVYTLPFDNIDKVVYGEAKNGPAFLKGSFRTDSNADCFIDMTGFTKGVVFVNGINLGRYWKIGPQRTLYLPGCWLKTDCENEIVVFEQEPTGTRAVNIIAEPKLG